MFIAVRGNGTRCLEELEEIDRDRSAKCRYRRRSGQTYGLLRMWKDAEGSPAVPKRSTRTISTGMRHVAAEQFERHRDDVGSCENSGNLSVG